jgi:hypothetical protein
MSGSKFWDTFNAANPHIADVRDDVYNKLILEGWSGRLQPEIRPGTDAAETKKPGTIHGEVVGETTKGPGQSDAIYEEIWGRAPTYAEVYGQLSNQGSAPAIAPPEPAQVSNGPEPEV